MNTADKARLEELKLRVYAKYAVKALNKEDLALTDQEIESNRGRVNKAIGLLRDANIIRPLPKELFEVMDIEDAHQYESKPLHTVKWFNLVKDVEEVDTLLDYVKIDYKYPERFSEPEQIYIYFHKNEFDVKIRNGVSFCYRKDLVERRDKFVLKCIVEQEIKYNLPKYISMYAGTDPETIHCEDTAKFKFDKYCISTVIEQDLLEDIFKTYTEHYEKILLYQEAMDKTVRWIDSVGGFEEAIHIIRKGIIEDLSNNLVRFPKSFRYEDKGDSYFNENKDNDLGDGVFNFIKRVKDLFTYDILYAEGEMDGVAFDPDIDINLEDEFDEPKEADQKEAA